MRSMFEGIAQQIAKAQAAAAEGLAQQLQTVAERIERIEQTPSSPRHTERIVDRDETTGLIRAIRERVLDD